ncbi:hypothetical protein ACFYKX_13410 [Cytobacillus sp. FJAT-54145]|uniref:Uncharacterized protein n=1 Tax=Cytobacillus spartinae TaxID=3299023 RepID=A0ABW6KBM3_9BACI
MKSQKLLQVRTGEEGKSREELEVASSSDRRRRKRLRTVRSYSKFGQDKKEKAVKSQKLFRVLTREGEKRL